MYVRKTHEICPVGFAGWLACRQVVCITYVKEMMCGQLIGSIGLINNFFLEDQLDNYLTRRDPLAD